MSEQEKKDKRFSVIVSAIIHSGIIALFLVLVAWREPDPPIPEYGIELNLGFQEQGSGDTEKTFDAPAEETENDISPDAEADTENTDVEEVQEEEVTEPEEVLEETTPVEETVETPPVEETVEETPPVEETVEETVTSPEKAEVKVEEKAPPVEEIKKVEEEKPVEVKKEVEKPVEEKKVEEKPVEKPKPKPKPTLDNRALMGGKKTNTDSKEEASNNQGTTNEKGNEGDPKGNPNTKGLTPGGADAGVSLSLVGWKWTQPPSEKDGSQIDGQITFQIEVNSRGKVNTATVIPGGSTISDYEVIDFYKRQVMKIQFLQTDSSKLPAELSRGTVTFVIKTN